MRRMNNIKISLQYKGLNTYFQQIISKWVTEISRSLIWESKLIPFDSNGTPKSDARERGEIGGGGSEIIPASDVSPIEFINVLLHLETRYQLQVSTWS